MKKTSIEIKNEDLVFSYTDWPDGGTVVDGPTPYYTSSDWSDASPAVISNDKYKNKKKIKKEPIKKRI